MEVEDVLRSKPERATLRHPTDENFAWLGRAAAVVRASDGARGLRFDNLVRRFVGPMAREADVAFREMMVILHQTRPDLLRGAHPVNIAIDQGSVFDYFDGVRKAVSLATQDILFVDPYLDAELVSKYMPHVQDDVTIRILTSESKLSSLIPAAQAFSQQHERVIAVRVSTGLHDRFVIIDRSACYQSGASFKDGAKRAPTTLTEITDVFQAVCDNYERLWASADRAG